MGRGRVVGKGPVQRNQHRPRVALLVRVAALDHVETTRPSIAAIAAAAIAAAAVAAAAIAAAAIPAHHAILSRQARGTPPATTLPHLHVEAAVREALGWRGRRRPHELRWEGEGGG